MNGGKLINNDTLCVSLCRFRFTSGGQATGTNLVLKLSWRIERYYSGGIHVSVNNRR